MLDADISLSDGCMKLLLSGGNAEPAQAILLGLQLHLEQLAEQYPKNIKIEFSEVQQSC